MKFPRGRRLPALLMAFCLFGIGVSSAQVVDVPNKKEIITKGRQSYYNLHKEGLAGYTCEFSPNWNALLADLRKSDPEAADKTMKTLKQIQFSMTLSPDDRVKIEHTLPLAVNAQDLAPYKDFFSGMEQMMVGFFQTATPFILSSPLPESDGDYKLEDQGAQYLLTYKEGGAGITTLMNKNLILSNLTVTMQENVTSLNPTFFKNPKGLLLSGYDATVKAKDPGQNTVLNTRIGYQEIQGLQLIQTLNIAGSYGESSFAFEILFTDYQITRK
jgi:hypothetical protein